jgi:acetyl-CoA carboxylase carboxyl transferase subunit alpha
MKPPYNAPAQPMRTYLDFEKPIAEIEGKIEELRQVAGGDDAVDVKGEVARLEIKAGTQLTDIYSKLSRWQKVQVARHPARPHFSDFVSQLLEDFTPLAGDRNFANDEAIIGGLGRFKGRSVVVIGQEKGSDTQSRMRHNFGMARPEGYRKSVRLMQLAERFDIPILTLVDTSGAYPGIGAEERGQSEAIARSTEMCLNVGVPLVSVIIGEGGSGGAVAIATGNAVMMLEHAVYSVISPEACSSILWREASKAQDAATAMKITAQDLLEIKIIDSIIPEPVGGAHRDPVKMILDTGVAIEKSLKTFVGMSPQEIKQQRRAKFLAMGREGLA